MIKTLTSRNCIFESRSIELEAIWYLATADFKSFTSLNHMLVNNLKIFTSRNNLTTRELRIFTSRINLGMPSGIARLTSRNLIADTTAIKTLTSKNNLRVLATLTSRNMIASSTGKAELTSLNNLNPTFVKTLTSRNMINSTATIKHFKSMNHILPSNSGIARLTSYIHIIETGVVGDTYMVVLKPFTEV